MKFEALLFKIFRRPVLISFYSLLFFSLERRTPGDIFVFYLTKLPLYGIIVSTLRQKAVFGGIMDDADGDTCHSSTVNKIDFQA